LSVDKIVLSAMNRILGDFWNFYGVGQLISNTRDRRKVWIWSWTGDTWIDCVSGLNPTKNDYPGLGGTDSEGHHISFLKTW